MKPTGSRPMSLAMLVMAMCSMLFAAGCSSSGSGVVASPIMFTYVPGAGPSPSVTTVLGAASTASVAEIEIHVTGVLDVLTASFTLDYDPATVGFLDFDAAGSHLASDGTTIQPIAQLTGAGQVTVGVTRLGATGIDFNTAQFLIKIRFLRVTANGTSMLAFGNNELLDSMTPPQPIAGVQWFGGTFQVN